MFWVEKQSSMADDRSANDHQKTWKKGTTKTIYDQGSTRKKKGEQSSFFNKIDVNQINVKQKKTNKPQIIIIGEMCLCSSTFDLAIEMGDKLCQLQEWNEQEHT